MTDLLRRLASNALAAALVLAAALLAAPASAQAPIIAPSSSGEEAPSLPDELTPDMVDALLARLTDADIRELLRQELVRRAEETEAAQAAAVSTLDAIEARYAAFVENASRTFNFMLRNLGEIGERGPRIEQRLAMAEDGVAAMLGAAALIFCGAIAAGLLAHVLLGGWRRWLMATEGVSYWDRLVRTIALTFVEFAPLVAFALALNAIAPTVQGSLGPLREPNWDYIAIFEESVLAVWAAIVLSRRIFAPWSPQLRIAQLSDANALGVHRTLRAAMFIGGGGWLIAGIWGAIGVGVGVSVFTVALSGLCVFLFLAFETIRFRRTIRELIADAIAGRRLDD